MENKNKIILDLCGGTGSWSKDYKDNGYIVINVTLPDYDLLDEKVVQYCISLRPYGILAAPTCTDFSFARTRAKIPRDLKKGMKLVIACLNVVWGCQYKIKSDQQKYPPLKFWVLENPYYGMLKWFLGKPALIFNPHDFGDAYQKRTVLWGYFNEPILKPVKLTKEMKELAKKNNYLHRIGTKFDMLLTKEIAPEYYGKLTRQERRAITPPGFAKAFYEVNK